jgi:hypothetical protein
MLLSPPTFVEPVSVCSRRVRLSGQVKDAIVEVVGGGGRPVGKWKADWPDQLFDLDPAITLVAGETLSAKQTHGPDFSPFSSAGIAVQAAGPSSPLFGLPVVACSERVVAKGLAPGATGTVRNAASGVPLGSSAGGTIEAVTLSRHLTIGDRILLDATPCGGVPGAQSAEPPIEALRTVGPDDRHLVTVDIAQPLLACQRLLTIHRGQPGTTLWIERGDGQQITFAVDTTDSTLRIDPPLKEGETIAWWVEGERPCEVLPSDRLTATATVGPPPAPRITTDPCPGSPVLHCSEMWPSATVHIRVDGVDSLEFEAAATDKDVDLGGLALVAGQRLVAVQRLCNDWSAASPPVVVAPPWDIEPTIVEPLVHCAPIVVLQGVSPGALVIVRSQQRKGELGRAVADGTAIAVDIAPFLNSGDTIEVSVVGCHPAQLKALVGPQVDIPRPQVVQAYIGTRTVVVAPVVAGSIVDVIVSGHHAGGTIATERSADIVVADALIGTDQIEILVRLCAEQRRTEPVSPTPAPAPAYSLLAGGGIDCGGGNWASGQVEVVVATPGDILVVGCFEAGVWISHPDGSAEPVSYGWPGAGVRGLAADPTNALHVFAATVGGLRETDPASPDPLHSWRDVALPAAANGQLAAVTVTSDRVVVIAAAAGLFWSPIPAAGGSWNFRTDPAVARPCSAVEWVSGGVVAAAPGAPGAPAIPPKPAVPPTPPALFRGDWIAATGTFAWAEQAGTAQAPFTARMGRTLLAVCAGDRNQVYAMSADNANDQVVGVLRSQDGGRTWTCPHLAANPALDQFQLSRPCDMGLQATRDIGIAVHPTNPQQILIAGRRSGLLGSTDGGATFDPGAWGSVSDASFHGDNRLIAYDTSTGTPRVLVGSDGGLYVSKDQDGKWWDSSRNRGLSTMMVVGGPMGYLYAPSLASAPAVPASCSVGLQDNGEAWTVAGTWWHQRVSGDGGRQVAVQGNILFHAQNEFATLQWSAFSPTDLGPSHNVQKPAATPTETQPAFETYLVAVDSPQWKDAAGHLLVAYAAEMVGPQPVNPGDPPRIPNLYGIFDVGSGAGDDRFVGVRLARLPGTATGIASFDGRNAVVCTKDAVDAPHLYRFDAAASTFVESTLPAGTKSSLASPVLAGPRSGVVIVNGGLLWSDDLLVWAPYPAGLPGGISSVAIDRTEHPPAVHVGTDGRVVVVRERGALVTDATGLPVESRSQQLSVVTDAAGDRWAYLGSWAWSVWRAKLS